MTPEVQKCPVGSCREQIRHCYIDILNLWKEYSEVLNDNKFWLLWLTEYAYMCVCVCVCVCVCMYVRIMYVCVCMYVCTYYVCVCMYVCMYVRTYVRGCIIEKQHKEYGGKTH